MKKIMKKKKKTKLERNTNEYPMSSTYVNLLRGYFSLI